MRFKIQIKNPTLTYILIDSWLSFMACMKVAHGEGELDPYVKPKLYGEYVLSKCGHRLIKLDVSSIWTSGA